MICRVSPAVNLPGSSPWLFNPCIRPSWGSPILQAPNPAPGIRKNGTTRTQAIGSVRASWRGKKAAKLEDGNSHGTEINQWSFLVPLIGGIGDIYIYNVYIDLYYIITQLAVYTTYIPLVYGLLGDYISPIPPIKGTFETAVDSVSSSRASSSGSIHFIFGKFKLKITLKVKKPTSISHLLHWNHFTAIQDGISWGKNLPKKDHLYPSILESTITMGRKDGT